jgi:hypothetical protein
MKITNEGGNTLSTEVTKRDEALEVMLAAQEAEFDAGMVQTPMLKLAQALTKEVSEGDVKGGEFINTLTGRSLGTKIDFVVSYYHTGRFASAENRVFVAGSEELIPESWADLVGPEFVGTRFDQYPEAEEEFRRQVNAKERDWGHGPRVSTTHIFTGIAITEDEDGDPEYQPVRLSLQRVATKAATKILTLKRTVLNKKPFWDVVFEISSDRVTNKADKSFYVPVVKLGRKTDAEERAVAREIAEAVFSGRAVSNEAEAVDDPAAGEVKAEGALGI